MIMCVCLVCKVAEKQLTVMSTNTTSDENMDYIQMYQSTFYIEFPSKDVFGAHYQLCTDCIKLLQQSYEFKKLSEIAYRQLWMQTTDITEISDKTVHITENEDFSHDDVNVKNGNFSNTNTQSENKLDNSKSESNRKKHKLKSRKDLCKPKINEGCDGLLVKDMSTFIDDQDGVCAFSDGEDNLSDCSTKTDEILKATGFYLQRNTPTVEPPPKKIKLNEGSLICPMCDKQFDIFPETRKHYFTHFPNQLCYICGKILVSEQAYYQHINLHDESKINHVCDLCDKVCKTRMILKAHIRIFHKRKNVAKCYYCPMEFRGSMSRVRHMHKVHDMPWKFHQCTRCDKKYFDRTKLRDHEERAHIRNPKYICDVCSSAYIVKRDLQDHMRYKHGGELPQCSVCGRSYASHKSLKAHMRIHLNIKNFKCKHCDKAFVQGTSLKFHIKKHHQSV